MSIDRGKRLDVIGIELLITLRKYRRPKLRNVFQRRNVCNNLLPSKRTSMSDTVRPYSDRHNGTIYKMWYVPQKIRRRLVNKTEQIRLFLMLNCTFHQPNARDARLPSETHPSRMYNVYIIGLYKQCINVDVSRFVIDV